MAEIVSDTHNLQNLTDYIFTQEFSGQQKEDFKYNFNDASFTLIVTCMTILSSDRAL